MGNDETMITKGASPARSHCVIITHIFLGSLVERNYRAELVHKRYHAKCLVTSVHRNAPKDMGNDETRREASANYDILRTCSSIDLFCHQQYAIVIVDAFNSIISQRT